MDTEDVKLLEELFILEGIFFDPYSVEELESSYEDVTLQTISSLQEFVEELVSSVEEVSWTFRILWNSRILSTISMTSGSLFDAFSIKKTKKKILKSYKSSRWEYILVLYFTSTSKCKSVHGQLLQAVPKTNPFTSYLESFQMLWMWTIESIFMFWSTYKFWDFVLFQLKKKNKALKARVEAAERLNALPKECGKYSNVLHKILCAFSFIKSWTGSFSSVKMLKWRLHCHFMVLSYTQKVYTVQV